MRTPAPVPPPATESFGSSPADSHPAMNLRISRGWSFGQGHCKAHDRESYGYQGLPKGSVRPITLGTWGFVARTYRNHVGTVARSEEHTSELQSRFDLVCRLLLEKKKK